MYKINHIFCIIIICIATFEPKKVRTKKKSAHLQNLMKNFIKIHSFGSVVRGLCINKQIWVRSHQKLSDHFCVSLLEKNSIVGNKVFVWFHVMS